MPFLILGQSSLSLAFAIGANDVANALGTSVGSKALTIKKAIIVGAIFEFLGTVTMGRFVAATLKSGIVDVNKYIIEDKLPYFVLGMFCALLAATLWLLLATYFGLPVSTTHTIVSGIVGFSLLEFGTDGIDGWGIGKVLVSWVVSPFLGALGGFVFFFVVHISVLRRKTPFLNSVRFLPLFSGVTLAILSLFLILKSPSEAIKEAIPWWGELMIFLAVGVITSALVYLFAVPWILKRIYFYPDPSNPESREDKIEEKLVQTLTQLEDEKDDNEKVEVETPEPEFVETPNGVVKLAVPILSAEENFKLLMVLTAVFVAFAHGANDVANAVGPFSAIIEYHEIGTIDPDNGDIPFWIILLGGVGIVIGLAVFGEKVMLTIGEKITKLTFTRGYSSQLAAAITVMLASVMGIPVSTTHILVGSVTGIGLVPNSNVSGLNFKTLIKILIGWAVTVAAGLLGSMVLYAALRPALK